MSKKFINRKFVFSTIAALATISTGVAFIASAQFSTTSKANNSIPTQSNSTQVVVGQPIKLTTQQRQQIFNSIQQKSNQINSVLTSSQRDKLRHALQSGKKYNKAVQSLNLTADQNQRITLINNASKLKVKLMGTQQQLRLNSNESTAR